MKNVAKHKEISCQKRLNLMILFCIFKNLRSNRTSRNTEVIVMELNNKNKNISS